MTSLPSLPGDSEPMCILAAQKQKKGKNTIPGGGAPASRGKKEKASASGSSKRKATHDPELEALCLKKKQLSVRNNSARFLALEGSNAFVCFLVAHVYCWRDGMIEQLCGLLRMRSWLMRLRKQMTYCVLAASSGFTSVALRT
jgi:hypothetical protein